MIFFYCFKYLRCRLSKKKNTEGTLEFIRTKLTYLFHMERDVFVDVGKGGFGFFVTFAPLKEFEMLKQNKKKGIN